MYKTFHHYGETYKKRFTIMVKRFVHFVALFFVTASALNFIRTLF